jgi:ssDNA-binding Zn-finger/Zn-ribbon topoisomerase 1
MIQDPNTQTNLPNNDIIELVSEQQLHAITGGVDCPNCKPIAEMAEKRARKLQETRYPSDLTKSAAGAYQRLANHVKGGCPNCEEHMNKLHHLDILSQAGGIQR